jgi:hypothetical protein
MGQGMRLGEDFTDNFNMLITKLSLNVEQAAHLRLVMSGSNKITKDDRSA